MSKWEDRITTRDFVKQFVGWDDQDCQFNDRDNTVEVSLGGRSYSLSLTPMAPKLEEFGLKVRDEVRFREKPNGNWKTGIVLGANPDGSLNLKQDSNGFARSIHAEHIEKKGVGKRGGSTWISLPT